MSKKSISNILHIDSSLDNVGIGTSSPTAKLHISGASSASTALAVVSGLVGIGKTPDTYLLDLEGNGTVLRVRDNQGFGNLLQVNTTNIDLFDNQGNQVFTVKNTNGSSNIKGANITLCQDGLDIGRGTQFGGEVQFITAGIHLGLVTDNSAKDIIFGIGGANEKLRVKNQEILSQNPIGIGLGTGSTSATLHVKNITGTTLQIEGDSKFDGSIILKTGSTGNAGVVTMSAGTSTITISTTKVKANSLIFISGKTIEANNVYERKNARVVGSSFQIDTISGGNLANNMDIEWFIIDMF